MTDQRVIAIEQATLNARREGMIREGKPPPLLVLAGPALWQELVKIADPRQEMAWSWSSIDHTVRVFDVPVHPVDEPGLVAVDAWRLVRDLGAGT